MSLPFQTSHPHVPEAVTMVPVKDIHSDPQIFQFRAGGNAQGEVESHTIAHRDPGKAMKPLWLYEGADGRISVVDGHHRLAYARRENIEAVPARMLRCRDGVSPMDAMVFGAYINLDEEFGRRQQHTAREVVDAAAVFHKVHNGQAKEVAPLPVPVRQPGPLQDAYVAGALSDPAFSYVERGEVAVRAAAIVAEAFDEPTTQVAVMDFVRSSSRPMHHCV